MVAPFVFEVEFIAPMVRVVSLPFVPAIPCGPCGPVAPTAPSFPAGPCAPVAPPFPVAPSLAASRLIHPNEPVVIDETEVSKAKSESVKKL